MKPIMVDSSLIDNLYNNKSLEYKWDNWFEQEPYLNSYHLLKGPSKASAIVKYFDEDIFKLVDNKCSIEKSIKGKDVYQTCLIDALKDDFIKLLAVTGPAGSGKTYITMAWALTEAIMNNKDVVCCKPTELVKNSKFIAAVPGTIEEKYAPFLDSFSMAIKKAFPESNYIKLLMEKGKLRFKPVELVRGDSYENTIVILDEAQNLDWHSTKTLLTRLGEDCKAVLIGDINQKDVNRNTKSGFELLKSSEIFKDSELTCSLDLVNDYRGPLSRLVTTIAYEVESS